MDALAGSGRSERRGHHNNYPRPPSAASRPHTACASRRHSSPRHCDCLTPAWYLLSSSRMLRSICPLCVVHEKHMLSGSQYGGVGNRVERCFLNVAGGVAPAPPAGAFASPPLPGKSWCLVQWHLQCSITQLDGAAVNISMKLCLDRGQSYFPDHSACCSASCKSRWALLTVCSFGEDF